MLNQDDIEIKWISLDSSNHLKFSKHLIFRVYKGGQEIVFQDIEALNNCIETYWEFFFVHVFRGEQISDPELDCDLSEFVLRLKEKQDNVQEVFEYRERLMNGHVDVKEYKSGE